MVYVAKVENDRVNLYDASSGNRKRSFRAHGTAVSAVVQGNTVSVTTDKGKVEIWDTNGNFQREI